MAPNPPYDLTSSPHYHTLALHYYTGSDRPSQTQPWHGVPTSLSYFSFTGNVTLEEHAKVTSPGEGATSLTHTWKLCRANSTGKRPGLTRNCHSSQEASETNQPNAMWDPAAWVRFKQTKNKKMVGDIWSWNGFPIKIVNFFRCENGFTLTLLSPYLLELHTGIRMGKMIRCMALSLKYIRKTWYVLIIFFARKPFVYIWCPIVLCTRIIVRFSVYIYKFLW